MPDEIVTIREDSSTVIYSVRQSLTYGLSQQVIDHVTVYVGQPSVDSVVTNGQLAVINAEQMQNRGVDVVDLRRVVSIQRLVAPLV